MSAWPPVNHDDVKAQVDLKLAITDASATYLREVARQGATFDPVAYGAVLDGSTDDSVAIRNCITAALAYAAASPNKYAEIRPSIAGTSVIGGALQTSGGCYAQLPIAYQANSAPTVTLRFCGPTDVPAVNGTYGQTVASTGGWILKSTLTGQSWSATYGLPSVLGGADFDKGLSGGLFSNIVVIVDRGVVFRVPDNPTVCALNLGGCNGAIVESGVATATGAKGWGITSVTQPTAPTGVGLMMPQQNNNGGGVSLIKGWKAIGTYVGLIPGEHTATFPNAVLTHQCVISTGVYTPGGHEWTADVSTEWCPYTLAGWSPTSGVIDLTAASQGPFRVSFDVEDANSPYTSGWNTPVSHVKDANNAFRGKAEFVQAVAGVGLSAPASLLTTGAANLTIVDLSQPTTGGSWTAATYVNSWLTATTPSDYITPAAYRLTADGKHVEIRGWVKAGASGSTVFTLPVALRPTWRIGFATLGYGCTNNLAFVDIGADGTVGVTYAGGTPAELSLHTTFALV